MVKNVDFSEYKNNGISKIMQSELATSWKLKVAIPLEFFDSGSEDKEIHVEKYN